MPFRVKLKRYILIKIFILRGERALKRIAFISIFLTLASSIVFAQNGSEKEIRELEKQWLIESYKTGVMTNFDRIVADGFRIT